MTIKDIAAMTGYSVGTVSRALNNHPSVSQEARRVILAVADEHGFQFNANARQLKQQRSNSVMVVVKGSANQFIGELFEAVRRELSKTRFSVQLDYIAEDSNEVLRAVQLCREKKPVGIVFLGGNYRYFQADFGKIDIPCVLVTNDAAGLCFPNLSSVRVDDREASRQAVEALIRRGHREFVVAGGDHELSDTSRLRYEGCVQAFVNGGICFDPRRDYRCGAYSYLSGYESTRAFLESGRRFTALVATADVIAVGAIRALREHGLRVPEDVSVMGFDGLELGAYLQPQLATVRQPVEQLARRGVELLMDCVENGAPARHETVPYALWQRDSICPVEEKS